MPNFDWTCPFCARNATITDQSVHTDATFLTITNSAGARSFVTQFIVCPNPKCKRFTLTVFLREAAQDSNLRCVSGRQLRSWTLIPDSRAQSFPSCIPKAILDDYNEACLIRDTSPKASATLSRRCLQGAIRDFWKVKPGRLVDEIAAIKDRVEPLTWQGIEAVRKVGNIGAHMETDINVIVDVEPQEAELLIELIEMLLRDWYITREARKTQLNSLIQLATDKEKEKKATTGT
jgi:hypothetical protein